MLNCANVIYLIEHAMLLNSDVTYYNPSVEKTGMRIVIGLAIFLGMLIMLAALKMSSISSERDDAEYEIDHSEDDVLPDKDSTKDR